MGDVAAALTWPLTRPLPQLRGALYLPSGGVKRVLFGPVNHDKCKLYAEESLKERYNEDKLKWNFDFERDRPLTPGRFRWEKSEDPSSADSNGGSATDEEKTKPEELEQTKITDFMRKRKSSNQKEFSTQRPKTRRRSST